MRERELKSHRTDCDAWRRWGRSLCGSVNWNISAEKYPLTISVAPCAGAWIEIHFPWNYSHSCIVAPCAGAWIEIICLSLKPTPRKSLPVRERELKCYLHRKFALQPQRRSLCGSVNWNNFFSAFICHFFQVAPCAGAWIEILESISLFFSWLSRSLCGSVNWNIQRPTLFDSVFSRSLCGSVNWNHHRTTAYPPASGRSLCGSVNWNQRSAARPCWQERRSLCGSVNWNWRMAGVPPTGVWSLPVRERELKSKNIDLLAGDSVGRSLCGSVNWNLYADPGHDTCWRRSLCGSVNWNLQWHHHANYHSKSLPVRERELKSAYQA